MEDMNTPETEFSAGSDVAGYTVVFREAKRPRVHLLRPYNACNTEKRKAGRDTLSFEGSREELIARLGKPGISCKRCFPDPTSEQRSVQELTMSADNTASTNVDLEDFEIGPESLPEGYVEPDGTQEAEG